MIPTDFPQSNARFLTPEGMTEDQVAPISAWIGETTRGALDGVDIVVVAWTPTARELAELNAGAPVFLTTLGGLPPHMLTTNFAQAIDPK